MAKRCEICEKGPVSGRTYTYRGKAKKDGGVGKKVVRNSLRRFLPNLQSARVMVEGRVKKIQVCTTCIKKGKITRVPRVAKTAKAA